MWAQLITIRIKPGRQGDLATVAGKLREIEQADSGLLRSTATLDQHDTGRAYIFVVFESEEKARVREHDPRRQEGLAEIRALMADMCEGAPEFIDLAVVLDQSP
jgi:quinol monooxygenase YgiN